MRECAERELAPPLPAIHAGRPVTFEGRASSRNPVAVARLAEAYEHAGFQVAEFYPEPVAATLSWLHGARHGQNGIALTVDFGGGTLDLAAVRFDGAKFEVLATNGVALGGDRIDQLIFERMLFPELGKGERWVREVDGKQVDTLFPFHEFEAALINWQTTFMLNQNYTARDGGGSSRAWWIRRGEVPAPARSHLVQLQPQLLPGHQARQGRAVGAHGTIIDIPELNLAVPFSRVELDAILVPALATLHERVTTLLSMARIASDDVTVVVRTGGTSEIVAVRRLLEDLFPGRVEGHDPFTSVACGLAIANYSGAQSRLG